MHLRKAVYALMGKIYKRLEMHEKAMFCFGLALDLKPPAADVATIKVLLLTQNLSFFFAHMSEQGDCSYECIDLYFFSIVSFQTHFPCKEINCGSPTFFRIHDKQEH